MHFSIRVATLWCCLLPMGAASAASASPAPDPAGPDAAPDAAAKHARRTACLKEAKARKLVNGARDSFIKACIQR